jgi:hypothetical protein
MSMMLKIDFFSDSSSWFNKRNFSTSLLS